MVVVRRGQQRVLTVPPQSVLDRPQNPRVIYQREKGQVKVLVNSPYGSSVWLPLVLLSEYSVFDLTYYGKVDVRVTQANSKTGVLAQTDGSDSVFWRP